MNKNVSCQCSLFYYLAQESFCSRKTRILTRALARMPVLPHTKKNIMLICLIGSPATPVLTFSLLLPPPPLTPPLCRLPQVWAELLLTAGILWTLPGVPRGCLGAQALEDQLPPHLHPALPRPPTRPRLWGQRRDPRRSRRPLRPSTWLLAVSSSPTTRETSAAWWTSISPGP